MPAAGNIFMKPVDQSYGQNAQLWVAIGGFEKGHQHYPGYDDRLAPAISRADFEEVMGHIKGYMDANALFPGSTLCAICCLFPLCCCYVHCAAGKIKNDLNDMATIHLDASHRVKMWIEAKSALDQRPVGNQPASQGFSSHGHAFAKLVQEHKPHPQGQGPHHQGHPHHPHPHQPQPGHQNPQPKWVHIWPPEGYSLVIEVPMSAEGYFPIWRREVPVPKAPAPMAPAPQQMEMDKERRSVDAEGPGSKIQSVLKDRQEGGIEELHLICDVEARSCKQDELQEFMTTLPDVGGALEGVRATLCRGMGRRDQFMLFLWHESMQAWEKAQQERQTTSNRERFSDLCISYEVDIYEMKLQSQEGGNQVRANQIGHSEPEGEEVVVVTDIITLKDRDEEFLKMAGEYVAKLRDADGVLQVAVLRSMCKPHSYKVVERYTSAEAARKNMTKAAPSEMDLAICVYSKETRPYQRPHIESKECNEGNGNEIEAHPMSLF